MPRSSSTWSRGRHDRPGGHLVSATGVRPDIRLAESAGLKTRDGHIIVDEHMHASARDVYAAVDIALAHDITAGRRIRSEHLARRRARGSGRRASGRRLLRPWDQMPGFSCAVGDRSSSPAGGELRTYRLVDSGTGSRSGRSRGGVVSVLTLDATRL